MDKYTSFTIRIKIENTNKKISMRFIDSLQFMQSSLDQQVENLRKSISDPQELRNAFSPVDQQLPFVLLKPGSPFQPLTNHQFEMALRKGIYPYEHMINFDRLKEKQLPSREAFASQLSAKTLTEEEYQQAQQAWHLFNCQNMEDYTRVYVALDVLLLASVFERFRATCLHPEFGYGLDPAHFLTAPSLSWSAMLFRNYQQGIRIENMTDFNMLLMVEKGIRGGMCQVSHPFANANFKGMNPFNDSTLPCFNPYEPEQHILYLDANNLYGWAMSQPLPLGDYVWEKETETASNDQQQNLVWFNKDMQLVSAHICQLDPQGDYGWILEVDLDYPSHLHDLHNDYPLCPDRKHVLPSPYTLQLAERLGLNILKQKKLGVGHEKLIMDLKSKERYVIHYRNLQQCLLLGLVLRKVHRVIRFRQSSWLKPYIDLNTERRKQAKDAVAKDFFKLMNNAIFGKTMEQVRKRRNVEFIVGLKQVSRALKIIASPLIKQHRIIEDNAILALEKHLTTVTMNRPMALGMTILDLSKFHMFHFHYDIMLAHFGSSRLRMCYTDTDSLVYLLTAAPGKSVYDDLRALQEQHQCFDLSEIRNPQHPLLQGDVDKMRNARVLGKFKDELFGEPLIQFLALRPKMYSMIDNHGKEKARRKGIPRVVALQHRDYLKAFYGGRGEDVTFQRIDHNKRLRLETRQQNKLGINACDDKSYYLDAFTCLRYGHYLISKIE
jgi:hypothetical protein